MTALIPLDQWNANTYGGKFSINTLRAWARNGNIAPAPQKVGRDWLVDRAAKYVKNDRPSKIPCNVDMSIAATDPVVLSILNGSRKKLLKQ
ncbi:excisionase [Methylomonas montana]|uniref:excisionase n=1 Tax=Methylomonas montana TaxID=3058963 RepID=UPI0026586FB9|nr:excisionase [Methylomonas montana]WKJ88794.1 excisionase [Methylomonas montana]